MLHVSTLTATKDFLVLCYLDTYGVLHWVVDASAQLKTMIL